MNKIVEERREQLENRINTAKNNLRILEKRLNNEKYDYEDIKFQIEYTKNYIEQQEYYLNLLN